MAVRIRLKRMGAKKRPFYRLVVADSRSARDGRIIETLGHYDPLTDPSRVSVDAERAKVWLSQGAQPSDTARRLLRQAGVLEDAGAWLQAPRKAKAPRRDLFGADCKGVPSRMKELVTYLAQALVEHPEEVRVSQVEGEKSIILELRVASSDMGKVIGKQGRVAKALRTVVKAAAPRARSWFTSKSSVKTHWAG